MNRQRRLRTEWLGIQQGADSNDTWIRLTPRRQTELDVWDLHLLGPSESPFDGGEFHFVIRVPESYPFAPPGVMCMTPILHPNIITKGTIVLEDGLLSGGGGGRWGAHITLRTLARKLWSLLQNPDFDIAINKEADKLYQHDPSTFIEEACKYTRQFAPLTVFVAPDSLRQACINTTLLLPELVWLVAQCIYGSQLSYK
jgi:ubiquitin-protein ligase